MAAATNVRTWLMDQMRASLGDTYTLLPYDTNFVPSGPTVAFYRSRVTRAPEAPRSPYLVNEITLYCAADVQEGSEALDALDVVLDDVLVALDGIDNTVLTAAEYTVLGETVPCFRVTAEVTSRIVPTPATPDTEE